MSKIILNHHASTLIVKCEETGEFLLGKYDSGYPGKNKHWIERVKLLGGNYFYGKNTDASPKETVLREIGEEFSGKKAAAEEMAELQQHSFASLDEIKEIKNYLLNLNPFGDYFLHQPGPEDKPQTYVIQSVYRVSIPKKIINIVKENLNHGKSITNEGVLAVQNLDEIISGNPMTQGITGLIVGHSERVIVPHCFKDAFTFVPIGLPRNTYLEYTDNFEYRNHSK